MPSSSLDHMSASAAENYRKTLTRLQSFARLMDSQIELPVIRRRIGLDGIIGLIPGIGDAAGLLLSSYVVLEALRLRVPKQLIGRMLINALVEFVVGVVPVLGDLFDFYWKANMRNVQLLQTYIEKQLAPPPKPKQTGALLLVLIAVAIAIVFVLVRLSSQ